jgi:peptidoglycan/LPS O-acetylase OafA/YrhL
MISGDALRGVAMVCVMVFHAAAGASANLSLEAAMDPAGAFTLVGPLIFRLDVAVWTFFALSGYLVGGPFVRAWVEGRPWPHVGRYASRRLRRILPAFWLTVVVLYLLFGTRGASKQELLEVMLFSQAYDRSGFEQVFVQGWTVGVELSFYLALPLLALALSRLRLVRGTRRARLWSLMAFLAVITVASLVLRVQADPAGPVARSVVSVLWAFTPGLALAAWEADFRRTLAGTARGRQIGAGLLALFAVAFGIYWATMAIPGTWTAELCNLAIAGGLLGGLLTCQWAWGRMPAVLDGRVLHALGRWSFGFYLVHVAIIRELCLHLPDGISNDLALLYVSAVTFVIGLSLAALSWWLVEEPFIEQRLPRWPLRRAAASAVKAPA